VSAGAEDKIKEGEKELIFLNVSPAQVALKKMTLKTMTIIQQDQATALNQDN